MVPSWPSTMKDNDEQGYMSEKIADDYDAL
jgi:hypothetical protein